MPTGANSGPAETASAGTEARWPGGEGELRLVVDRMDPEARRAASTAGSSSATWMRLLTDPHSLPAQEALRRAIAARQGRPEEFERLLGSTSAWAVLPRVAPPVLTAGDLDILPRWIACEQAAFDAEDGDECDRGWPVAEANRAVAAQARVVRRMASLGLATGGDLFAYQWRSLVWFGAHLDEAAHRLAWSAAIDCLRGATAIDLRVGAAPARAEAPASAVEREGGLEMTLQADWSHVMAFGRATPWSMLRPALDGSFATLRALRVAWCDLIDGHDGGETAARELVCWLATLPYLAELDLRNPPLESAKPTAAREICGGSRATALPSLVTLRISHDTFEGFAAGLWPLGERGGEALPSLRHLQIDEVYGNGRARDLARMWSAIGQWADRLESLTISQHHLGALGAELPVFLAATDKVNHLIIEGREGANSASLRARVIAARMPPLATSWEQDPGVVPG